MSRRVPGLLVAVLAVFHLLEVPAGRAAEPTGRGKEHLLVQVAKDVTGFRLVKTTRVSSPLPRHRHQAGTYPWRCSVSNEKNRVLFETGFDDPSVLRGEFVNHRDPGKIDSVRVKKKEPYHFVVRLPIVAGARVDFLVLKPGRPRSVNPSREAFEKTGSIPYPAQENRP